MVDDKTAVGAYALKRERTLSSVENELSLSVLLFGASISVISIVIYAFLYFEYRASAIDDAQEDLTSSVQIYTNNLLNRMAIIASSSEFIEFVRSGPITRSQRNKRFIELMTRIPRDDISGFLIKNQGDEKIFSFGTATSDYLSTEICYLGYVLSPAFGQCEATVTLYLDRNNVIDKIKSINSNIALCDQCDGIDTLSYDSEFGLIVESAVNLPIEIKPNFDWRFYLFVVITFIALLIFAICSRAMIASVFRREIIAPLTYPFNLSNDPRKLPVKEILDIRDARNLLHLQKHIEDTEKRKIANEIHDLLGASLMRLRWDVEIAADGADTQSDANRLTAILERVDGLISTTTHIIERLRPEILDTLGLQEAIRRTIEEWREKLPTRRYEAYIDIPENLPDAVSHALFCIVEEALVNVAKHSQATEVSVSLDVDKTASPHCLRLCIRDNGVGVPPAGGSGGHGLTSMKERAIALRGQFWIEQQPETGAAIHVRLPIQLPEMMDPQTILTP
ncbi:sensor histidine kinase [Hahella sp. HN01]|uniref:sensor histidine kinase n=1 Tax=Hahella sp. HN01 TaxID=2847262 RepID=UPI001C1F1A0F|nr:sensor histidine kinase [Hahella sp. HN01]MBU6951615.1 sensor histidine kinase [Hahella sp. HN01]